MTVRRWGLVLLALGALLLLAAASLPAPTLAAAPAQATATPRAMATLDRLAAPPTVENPSQADVGAQVFWLNCQPCHGDLGQGLTQDWINQYPPEDRNCWESGCHGDRPYDDGFTLPRFVPAVIGPDTLLRFNSAADLHTYLARAMPFNAPGSLTTEEYWALTAFLLRAHPGAPATPAAPLESAEQAALIGIHGTVTPPTATVAMPTPTPVPTPPLWARPGGEWLWLAGVGAALTLGLALAGGLLARRAAQKKVAPDG